MPGGVCFTVNSAMKPELILRIAIALVIAGPLLPTVVDVDLWGHVMFGGDILRAGIPARDHYAFTSDLPWVDHEWLTEVIMFGAYTAHPRVGLVGLRLLLLASFLLIVWYDLRREGVPAPAAVTLVTVLTLLTYSRTQHVRPQLFSLAVFAALLVLLKSGDRGRIAVLFAIPPLMALWSNLHGGFVVGLLPLGLWAARASLDRSRTPRSRIVAVAALAAGVLATLANPYGIGLWEFLTRTLGPDRHDITEWLPVTSSGTAVMVFWTVTATLALAALWYGGRKEPFERTLLIMLLAVASFRVARLDAFFAVATIMCFGTTLSSILTRRTAATASRRRHVVASAAVFVAALSVAAYARQRDEKSGFQCVDMARADWLPEREAAAYVAEQGLRGHVVVFFDWGEYVLWHFAPQLRVSMDGRRETVYSNRHIEGHLQLYRGSRAGLEYLRDLNPDYVWLPSQLPVVRTLRSTGWHELYAGPRSVILGKLPAPPRGSTPVRGPASRCFPGP
jgi:hypothetical protein